MTLRNLLFFAQKPDSEHGFEFFIEFYIDYSGKKFFFIYFRFSVVDETQNVKFRGKPLFLTSAERGETVSAEICMSATEVYMPLLLIFPRVRENKEFLKEALHGAWAMFDKSGWIQFHLFTPWFSLAHQKKLQCYDNLMAIRRMSKIWKSLN